MDGKKADVVSTDEVREMDLGGLDQAPLLSRGDAFIKHANKTPEELATMLVNYIEAEVKSGRFNEEDKNELLTDLSLFIGLWGRKRKEEAVPALRKRVRDFLEKEGNIRKTLQEMLGRIDDALKASEELFADAAPPEDE